MLKIIHTADWHLGKFHEGLSRKEDHLIFIKWLLQILDKENVDAIIIAGDIFDTRNPSNESMDLYHQFLTEAIKLKIEVVIIGGNHDSSNRLNSTGSLFKYLNIHVVGGGEKTEELIPIKSKKTNKVELVVAAVPYLVDGDVRTILPGENAFKEKNSFKKAIKNHYNSILEKSKQQFPNIPIITTAHLSIYGSKLSDGDVLLEEKKPNYHSLGTIDNLPAEIFSSEFAYVALGHIHKAQVVPHPQTIIKYAGSPITLTFNEKNDIKEITLMELIENEKKAKEITHKSLQVPITRFFKTIKGSRSEIREALDLHNLENKEMLQSQLEIILTEKTNNQEFRFELDEYVKNYNCKICKLTTDSSIIFQDITIRDTIIENVEFLGEKDGILKVFERKYWSEYAGNESELEELKMMLIQVLENLEMDKK